MQTMNENKVRFGAIVLVLFLLSIAIVSGFRMLLLIPMDSYRDPKALKEVKRATREQKKLLEKCIAGTLSKQSVDAITDDDLSREIFNEMKAYNDNFTKVTSGGNERSEITYAPNIQKLVNELNPPARLFSLVDISWPTVHEYPYIHGNMSQMPHFLVDESNWEDQPDIITMLLQGDTVKVVKFVSREIKYEMWEIDSFDTADVMDETGRFKGALYFVPPPTEENRTRPYDEPSTGCDLPHYSDLDCGQEPPPYKIRFQDGATRYYSSSDGKPSD